MAEHEFTAAERLEIIRLIGAGGWDNLEAAQALILAALRGEFGGG